MRYGRVIEVTAEIRDAFRRGGPVVYDAARRTFVAVLTELVTYPSEWSHRIWPTSPTSFSLIFSNCSVQMLGVGQTSNSINAIRFGRSDFVS